MGLIWHAHIGPVPLEEMLIALPAVGALLSALLLRLSLAVRGLGRRDDE